jgi:hypothetical protein
MMELTAPRKSNASATNTAIAGHLSVTCDMGLTASPLYLSPAPEMLAEKTSARSDNSLPGETTVECTTARQSKIRRVAFLFLANEASITTVPGDRNTVSTVLFDNKQ